MPAIEAEGAYKVFGRRGQAAVARLQSGATRAHVAEEFGATAAVIDANFNVEPGEVFVVMGLSGSGKSTLIRMVNGLVEATAGSVRIQGEDVTSMSAKQLRKVRREQVSMVFQHFALFPHRTVAVNAAYGLETQGVGKKERQEKAAEALSMVGLEGWEDHLPAPLSGGMQQRVGLARALAAETSVMLMDEAFSALDPPLRREMQDQLIGLQRRLHKTIIFVTHDLSEAMRLGDRIAVMRNGEIVQIGTAEKILNEPANEYVAQFVQDVDRSRVLTAATVMETVPAVLDSAQGPRAAQELLGRDQCPALFVVDDHQGLVGVVHRFDVADAVGSGAASLAGILDRDHKAVYQETPLAELLARSAQSDVPLPVVDQDDRLVGVLPHEALLNALGDKCTAAQAGDTRRRADQQRKGEAQ